jgi:hypothetical protein
MHSKARHSLGPVVRCSSYFGLEAFMSMANVFKALADELEKIATGGGSALATAKELATLKNALLIGGGAVGAGQIRKVRRRYAMGRQMDMQNPQPF